MPPRIDILAVGSLAGDLRPVFDRYRRLLTTAVRLEVRQVREVAVGGRSESEVLREEGRRLLAAWPKNGTTVVLDEGGRSWDSPAFASAVQDWLARGMVTFVIGGSLGLADEIKARAHERLSLSAFTLPHQLARESDEAKHAESPQGRRLWRTTRDKRS